VLTDGHFRCWCVGSLIHPDDRAVLMSESAVWHMNPSLSCAFDVVLRVGEEDDGGGEEEEEEEEKEERDVHCDDAA
jgi:hypothetical protein